MSLPDPRHYQKKGLNLTRKAFSDGFRKILFFMATGGGKSIIFLHMVYNLIKGKRPVILVMRRRQLVFQAQKHFTKHGVDSSIVMGNSKGFDPNKDLQICSIDTISRRKDIQFLARFYAVVVDEAHDTTSPSYRKFFEKLNAELYFGLTATPFAVGRKVHDFWDCCVKPIEIKQLVEEGFLVEPEIYIPAFDTDLSDIRTVGADFNQGQLSERMRELEIVGDVVESYKKYGENYPAIFFGVDKEHSITVCQEFNNQGIRAIHCDESTNQKDRDYALAQVKIHLLSGEPFVLCNVNIFSTGVDCPEAIVGLFGRPTKSEILAVQQWGRILRPCRICGKCKTTYDNSDKCPVCDYDRPLFVKTKAIFIDNGNNISYEGQNHGHPLKERHAVLSKEDVEKKKKIESNELKLKSCKQCFRDFLAHLKKCPECGYENEKVERTVKKKDGTIVPYDEFGNIKRRLLEYEKIKLEKGLKPNFPFFKIYEDFGDVVYEYPDLKIPSWVGKIVKKNMEKEQKNVYK
jgi:superfamily II DNA or RNA helicase